MTYHIISCNMGSYDLLRVDNDSRTVLSSHDSLEQAQTALVNVYSPLTKKQAFMAATAEQHGCSWQADKSKQGLFLADEDMGYTTGCMVYCYNMAQVKVHLGY